MTGSGIAGWGGPSADPIRRKRRSSVGHKSGWWPPTCAQKSAPRKGRVSSAGADSVLHIHPTAAVINGAKWGIPLPGRLCFGRVSLRLYN